MEFRTVWNPYMVKPAAPIYVYVINSAAGDFAMYANTLFLLMVGLGMALIIPLAALAG